MSNSLSPHQTLPLKLATITAKKAKVVKFDLRPNEDRKFVNVMGDKVRVAWPNLKEKVRF